MSTMTTWNADPSHSEIGFKVKHMMISTVKGSFVDFKASAETETDDFKGARFTFSALIDSVTTRNADRDNHLKSAEFFDAEKFPEMKFVSKNNSGDKLTGDLTIKEVTKEVVLDLDFNGVAVDPYGQTKAGFEITGKISRKDFGLTWNAITEAGSVVVSDAVQIVVDLQLIKQAK